MEAFLAALAVVFVAEIGDKSQLLTLSLSTRLPLLAVLSGIISATAVLMGVSVVAGNLVGDLIPTRLALALSAGLFLAFGWWTLRGNDEETGDDDMEAGGGSRFAVLAVLVTFGLAELGDKTMLATFSLAAQAPAVATWAGATTGMVGANLLALGVGRALGAIVAPRTLRLVSACFFVVAGVALGTQAVLAH